MDVPSTCINFLTSRLPDMRPIEGRDLGSVTGPFPVLTEAPGSERHEDQLPLPGACSRCQRSRKCGRQPYKSSVRYRSTGDIPAG